MLARVARLPALLHERRELMALLFLLLLIAGAGPPSLASPPPEAARAAFERGQKLFAESVEIKKGRSSEHDQISRRYRAAAESFVAAWKAGAATTEVFTNAANSFYFSGAAGEAVLFYRRALSLDPSNRRAGEALEHIRAGLPVKRPSGGAGASILRSLFFWHEGLAFQARKAAFTVLYPGALACFALALFRRRPFLLIGMLLVIPALALLASLVSTALGDSTRRDAVILVEVEGRLGDGLMYSPSHSRPFPPGTEATILATRRPAESSAGSEASAGAAGAGEPWAHVRLLDGDECWVPERTIERVVP